MDWDRGRRFPLETASPCFFSSYRCPPKTHPGPACLARPVTFGEPPVRRGRRAAGWRQAAPKPLGAADKWIGFAFAFCGERRWKIPSCGQLVSQSRRGDHRPKRFWRLFQLGGIPKGGIPLGGLLSPISWPRKKWGRLPGRDPAREGGQHFLTAQETGLGWPA